MIGLVATYLLAVVCTEALVEIVVKSKLFFPLRDKIGSLAPSNKVFAFIHALISCGHCFSVWAAAAVVGTLFPFCGFGFVMLPAVPRFILLVLFVQRLSNYLHNAMDRVDKFYRKK